MTRERQAAARQVPAIRARMDIPWTGGADGCDNPSLAAGVWSGDMPRAFPASRGIIGEIAAAALRSGKSAARSPKPERVSNLEAARITSKIKRT
jgi:hypothetical protein